MINRRQFTQVFAWTTAAVFLPAAVVSAKTYLTIDQARALLWPDKQMKKIAVELSEDQMKAIKKASDVRVRHSTMHVWKVEGGGWFIVDQIIGKHENIDIAFAYFSDGTVKGFEIMTYRETYGYEVANPKWRSQFDGTNYQQHLKLDRQIQNISGATLSCRHITDGINRLNHTWALVLKSLV